MDEYYIAAETEAAAVSAIALRVAQANYIASAQLISELSTEELVDIRANLEFCLDMVCQEQRNRAYAS